jgi:sterol 3beta-glucosyltransferase
MDVTLLTYGSRGDVQPYVALARALRHIGHDVRLVAPPNFADLVHGYDIPFFPVGVDLQAHLNERIQELAKSGKSIQGLRSLRNELLSIMDDVARDTWQACQGTALVIGVGPASYSVAEKLDVPFIEAAMQPTTPTRAFSSPIAPTWLQLGGTVNQLTHVAFEQAFWQIFRVNANRLRTHVLGLPPYSLAGPLRRLREHGLLRLYAYSPRVVPRPDDWPNHHRVTGYWFLPPPARWHPPEALRTFLAAGPPPVYVGFGSMMMRDAQKTTALVIEALNRTGQRAILATGWGALDETMHQSERMFFVQDIPHYWLFPQMSAIVHHGGAGTTGAALRSGVPSIVVPFGFDQAFWGHRVAALGVGAQPLPRAKLSANGLADAIERTLQDRRMHDRATELGAQIRLEYGVAQAIDEIHRVLHSTSIA